MCRGIMEYENIGRSWVMEHEIDINESHRSLANLKIYKKAFDRRNIPTRMGL
jgi:hypothetical protein